MGFPGGTSGKEPTCQCKRLKRDAGLIPRLGRYPRGGHGNPLQYSCLENPMDRGAWQATVQRVTESDMTKVTQNPHTQGNFTGKTWMSKHNMSEGMKEVECRLTKTKHVSGKTRRMEHGIFTAQAKE